MRMWMLMMLVTGLSMAILMISLYNGLVRKRNLVRSAFSSIDVNLRKRHDLIPSLVDTVKGFARHEQDTLTALMDESFFASYRNGNVDCRSRGLAPNQPAPALMIPPEFRQRIQPILWDLAELEKG